MTFKVVVLTIGQMVTLKFVWLRQISLATLSLKVSVAVTRVLITAVLLKGPATAVRQEVAVSWQYSRTLGTAVAALVSTGKLVTVTVKMQMALATMGQVKTTLVAVAAQPVPVQATQVATVPKLEVALITKVVEEREAALSPPAVVVRLTMTVQLSSMQPREKLGMQPQVVSKEKVQLLQLCVLMRSKLRTASPREYLRFMKQLLVESSQGPIKVKQNQRSPHLTLFQLNITIVEAQPSRVV